MRWDSLSLFRIQMLLLPCINGESGLLDHLSRNVFMNGLNKKFIRFISNKIIMHLKMKSWLKLPLKQAKEKIKIKKFGLRTLKRKRKIKKMMKFQ